MKLVSFLRNSKPTWGVAVEGGVVDCGPKLGKKYPDLKALLAGRGLADVKKFVKGRKPDVPMGMCLDTAHSFAAGYELLSDAGFRRTLRAIRETVGLDRVRVIHFNDSKVAFGSNVDRHWHIGEGHIGLEGLGRVARCRALAHAALILETPVDADHDDAWNFARLRELAGYGGSRSSQRQTKEGTAG